MFKAICRRINLATTTQRRAATTLAAIIASAAVLASCSSGGASEAAALDGSINIQLSYLKNTEFAGEYFAVENGYFAEEGLPDVTLTAGGSAAAAAEPQVATGAAFLGITSPVFTGTAIKKGAPIKIIGATYQKNPFSVVSASADPITDGQSLKGKTIAVHDFNSLVWTALLTANDLTANDVKVVPFTDGPAQLLSGQVDGFLTYTTAFTGYIPNSNVPATEMLLSQSGLPMVSEVIIASVDTIENDRERLVHALTAIVKGWQDALADNPAAVALTVDKYGADQNLDYANELRMITTQNALMTTEDTAANGILTITPELQESTTATLSLAGVDINVAELFDLSVLEEVYANAPELRR